MQMVLCTDICKSRDFIIDKFYDILFKENSDKFDYRLILHKINIKYHINERDGYVCIYDVILKKVDDKDIVEVELCSSGISTTFQLMSKENLRDFKLNKILQNE